MGKIEGRRSGSVYNHNEYRRSWRAQRRKQFAKVRNAIRASAPPPIFGLITDILVVLAKSGPVRRVALYEMFSEMRIASLETMTDPGGITTGWQLPGSDKRGQRGAAVALDPQFPLAKEVRALLLALGKDFPFTATCDMTPAEMKIPKRKRTYNVEEIFVSKLRLRVLQAIDILGGEVKLSILADTIPGMRWIVVRDTVDQLARDGIVKRVGPNVRLVEAPWTKPLRSLLCAYRKKINPNLEREIKRQKKWVRSVRSKGISITLLGRNATERALKILAVDGPMTNAELELRALPRHRPHLLDRLTRSGIVVRQRVPKKHPERSDHFVVGLNAAHPIHKELRALLATMAGAKPNRKRQLVERRDEYSLEGLFMTAQRLNILVAVAIGIHGEIDPSTVNRFFPEHVEGMIMHRMKQWADQGLMIRRVEGLLTFYRFNPKHPHAKPLQALLERIGETWPQYRGLADLEIGLYPARRATNERRLARPLVTRRKISR